MTVADRLRGKVIIITGSARGIGRAYAERCAAEGARLVVADVIPTQAAVDAITKAGGEAIGVACDVSRAASVEAMAGAARQAFGGIDVLVNNAAMFATIRFGKLQDLDEQEWDRVMAINVKGPWLCVKAVLPAMIEGGGGKIINIASSTVYTGVPNFLHYVTSKGAIVAMTRAMARELGRHNITVNAIAPGYTMSTGTEHNPEKVNENTIRSRALRRTQYPEDLVGTLAHLASDDANFITGQVISVDGGEGMH
ncbi:MAG: 3-oxoacyl-ACP reductase FabG [Candidatus Tectomicrobia bacterium]|nr:3-oxoacyl-ACP reductase FabG [Candidatus Tectomicrobia bacterium]